MQVIANFLRLSPTKAATCVVALFVLIPLLMIADAWLRPASEHWPHILTVQIPNLLSNTALLLISVCTSSVIVGVASAWAVTHCEFPGRTIFSWLLLVPLAIPKYVLAFVLLGIIDYTGPIQSTLRNLGIDVAIGDPRNLATLTFVLTFCLSPYIYLTTRTAFVLRNQQLMDAAATLGLSHVQRFWRVSLPLAKTPILAGAGLVAMETLADFGTVSVFNFDTFTTAIYSSWFGLFDLTSAARLAGILLLIVGTASLLRTQVQSTNKQSVINVSPAVRIQPSWPIRWSISGLLCGWLLAGIGLPITQLIGWVLESTTNTFESTIELIVNTAILSLSTAAIIAVLAYAVAWTSQSKHWLSVMSARISTLGYALPGTLLAVAIATSSQSIVTTLSNWKWIEQSTTAGTFWLIIAAYCVRFLAVGVGPIATAIEQLPTAVTDAAKTLGANTMALTRRVHLPLLRSGLLTAIALIVADVSKEMPATLLLRPFGWDTLAVRIFELTSEGEWQRAAFPSLLLVIAGMVPVIALIRQTNKRLGNA